MISRSVYVRIDSFQRHADETSRITSDLMIRFLPLPTDAIARRQILQMKDFSIRLHYQENTATCYGRMHLQVHYADENDLYCDRQMS